MLVHDNIAFWSACSLRKHLQDRRLSPVDVAEACLEQYERHNPAINAIVTLNERFMDDARALEQKQPKGLLYGLPVGLKDTTETRGLRTTFGSPAFKDNTPGRDALIVKRLRAEGALILGKTNTPTFAAGATTWNPVFGHTRNPWNTSLTCGGSTGGGAAALAAGMIALSDGTDLGGSLRIPAAYCGVVGLRPSPGLVPHYPTMNLWDTLSVAGGMGRTAEDVALYLRAVAGPAKQCVVRPPARRKDYVNEIWTGPRADMRLGWCRDPAGIGIDPVVLVPCLEALDHMGLEGYPAQEVSLDLSDARHAFGVLRGHHLLTTHFARRTEHRALGRHLSGNLREAERTTSLELAAAVRVRNKLREQFRTLFRRIHYLLTPTVAVSPFPVEEPYPEHICGQPMRTYYDWLAPTSVFSLTGYPAVSVPCGLDGNQMPVGLQIIGTPGDEGGVLALAQWIQILCLIEHPPPAMEGLSGGGYRFHPDPVG